MKLVLSSLVGAIALTVALSAMKNPESKAQPSAVDEGEITVHVDQGGTRVSPSLYGVFFEEINHAGDGGLYAELIRNRSFEDASSPDGWSAVGTAKLALDTDEPLHENQAHSLRITTDGRERSGVSNGGFWGIAVRKSASYRLSFFARGTSLTPITASLESEGGGIYCSEKLGAPERGWRRMQATLRAPVDDPKARLVLSTTGEGTIWIDVVSLFPADTFKDRPNGLRVDLAEKVAAMRPAFVRFPGGCFVEGENIRNAFRWKETLGPIHARKGHLNDIWRYRSSDGLGYHEYLQMCEDTGAEAMFVVNCGMAHRDTIAMEELDPWVQDALDAVEYARGPVSSKWGALRAKNGHAKPFALRYVEIGNENGWGDTLSRYEERYARFYDALKAKYPDLRLIANVPVRNRPMDLVDDHYYNSPQWFWANANLYDRRSRSGPKIYIGEYAVTQNAGTGNLAAALGEAAFMTGMERNADLIEMASYAPLFVNTNDRRWNPDAIVFDSARSFGTPSYHVQKVFAENRPTVVYKTDVKAPESNAQKAEKGGVGLSTWNTQAEFKDVEVIRDGRMVYSSSLENEKPEWKRQGGTWAFREGALRQTGGGQDGRMVLDLPELANASDYTVKLRARKIAGAEGFLIMFRARSRDDFYWWNIGGWGNTLHAIEKGVGGAKMDIGPRISGRVETGRWYDIRIELTGPRIRCFLDDKLIEDVIEKGAPDLAAIGGKDEKKGEYVLKVVNGAETERRIAIKLDGASAVKPDGKAIVMTSRSLSDENSFDQPERIAPRTLAVSGVSDRFTYTFPARSVTVLRLRAR